MQATQLWSSTLIFLRLVFSRPDTFMSELLIQIAFVIFLIIRFLGKWGPSNIENTKGRKLFIIDLLESVLYCTQQY